MKKSFEICSPFENIRYLDYKNSYIYFTFKIKTKKVLIKEEYTSDLLLKSINGLELDGNKLIFPEECKPTLEGVLIDNFEYNILNKNTPNKQTSQKLPILQFNASFFNDADKYFDNGANINYLFFKETMYLDDKSCLWIILRCKVDSFGYTNPIFLENCNDLSSRFLKFEFESTHSQSNIFKHWYLEFPEFHILSEKENCELPIDFLYSGEDVENRQINITKQFFPFFDFFYTIKTINRTKENGLVLPSKDLIEYQKGSNATYLFNPYEDNEIKSLIIDNRYKDTAEKMYYFENINENHNIDVSFGNIGLEKIKVETEISNLSTGEGYITQTSFIGKGEMFRCEIIPKTGSYIHCVKVHKKQLDGTFKTEIANNDVFNNVLNLVITEETKIEVMFLSNLQNIAGKDLIIEFHYNYKIFDIVLNDGEYTLKHNEPPLLIKNYTNPILKMEITRNENTVNPSFTSFENTILMIHRKLSKPVFISGTDILVGYNTQNKEVGFKWCYNLDTTKTEGGYKLEFGQAHRLNLPISPVCPYIPEINLPEIPNCE